MKENIEDLLKLAVAVATEAGDYARSVRRSDLIIDSKSNEMDLVTQVDKRNETVIRKMILNRYPEHEFLGEEMGASQLGMGNEELGNADSNSSFLIPHCPNNASAGSSIRWMGR